MPSLPPAGILLIDKEEGWTSHDVVAALRTVLATKRVGHGGTLDPLATGLLPVLYGPATRFADELHRAPKSYLAEMVLGSETATDDREGKTTVEAPVPALSDDAVRALFGSFVGPYEQRPPAYSAVKVGGVRSYTLARRGAGVELSPRPVEIFELLLVERTEGCVHFLVTCSSGTYVRALARDLGRALGTRAHLGALRRLAAGGFFVEDAVSVAEARDLARAGALGALVFAPDAALLELPGAVVAREAARRLLGGQPVALHRSEASRVRVYDVGGDFLGTGEMKDGTLRPRTILPE